jgi:hypothetical protein
MTMQSRDADTDGQDQAGIAPVTLPDLTHSKHKPVLHIGENGHMASEDDLQIDTESLPMLGTDAADGTRQSD